MATTKKKRPRTDDRSAGAATPSVRTQTDWTPQRIRSIFRQVDSGDLHQAGILCDWVLADDRVKATVGARFDALFGLEPTFDLGVGRRSRQAVKALEAGEDWWEAYDPAQLRKMGTWGLLLGVSLFREEWVTRPDHGGRVLPVLTFWHPSCLKQDQKTKQWFARDANNQHHEVTAGDGEWILHTPFGPDRPWADGEWRVLALLVLAKSYAFTDRSRHSERSATFVVEAEENADNTEQHRRELAVAIGEMGGSGVLCLRPGLKAKLLEISANLANGYNSQIAQIDEAIAIVIRGGNLSTVTKEGSLAGAEQQAKTSDTPKLALDAAAISKTIHDQSLTWWAELNFGDQRLAPWPNYPVEPEENKQAKAKTINTVADALVKFDGLGYEIDDAALLEDFDMPWLGERLSREERAALAPKVAPDEGDDDSEGDSDDEEDEPSAKTGKAPKARGTFMARLASGAAVAKNRGFIDGQVYVDDVVDQAVPHATEALQPTLTQVVQALDEATGYEDLKDRLRALYGELSPADLSELVYRATTLAGFAGRHAVNEDA